MANSVPGDDYELSRVHTNNGHGRDEDFRNPAQIEQTLPPADYGRGAYVALACCTAAQAPIWGTCSISFKNNEVCRTLTQVYRVLCLFWHLSRVLQQS